MSLASPLPFPVVVLAGGEGRRIGGGKPLRILGGETLLGRAIRVASGWSDDVCVAVRHKTALDRSISLLADEPSLAGPLAALVSALRHANGRGCDRVMLIPCDTPFLPLNLPHRLDAEIGDANAAVASSAGQLHPVCSLWRVTVLDRLSGYLAGGRRSLHAFAEQVGFSAVDWPVEPFDPFFNINNAMQLQQAEAMLAS